MRGSGQRVRRCDQVQPYLIRSHPTECTSELGGVSVERTPARLVEGHPR